MTFFYKLAANFFGGLLLLLSFSAFSQIDISGRVVDELDGTPLTGATVYIDYTTIGTNTD